MTVTINGTSGITTPGVNSTGSNVLGDNVADTLNVGNGAIVTDSSGNVGIGTSSPSQKLHVYNSASATAARFQTTSAAATVIEFTDAGTTTSPYLGSRNNALYFGTDSSERMRIDSSGNLLVGKTASSTSTKGFEVSPNGTIQAIGDTGLAARLGRTDTGTVVNIFANTTTSVGSISVTGSATSYNTSSDYRLKENIQPMRNALGVVQQLNPVTYTWKADGSDGQGFIAHELQAVVPDCVTGEKDAVDADGNPVYQGIDTSFLVATLTKAIQEQQEQIEQMKQEIAALKGAA